MLFHVALRQTQSRPSTDICHNCLLVKQLSFIGVSILVYFLCVRTVMIEFIWPTRVLGRFLCALPVARLNVASPSENFAFQKSWLKAARGAAYPGRGTHQPSPKPCLHSSRIELPRYLSSFHSSSGELNKFDQITYCIYIYINI